MIRFVHRGGEFGGTTYFRNGDPNRRVRFDDEVVSPDIGATQETKGL